MMQVAGSTLVGVAHHHLPLSYMIVDSVFGKTLPQGSQGNRGDFPPSTMTSPLTRAGVDTMRVCVFHMDSKVANKKVGLAHECFASMFMDRLHYQVDLIVGDANMALYRYSGSSGSKQESIDIRGGLYQSTLGYFFGGLVRKPEVHASVLPEGTTHFCQRLMPPEAV